MLKAPGSREAFANNDKPSADVSAGDYVGTQEREKESQPDEGNGDCSEPNSVMQFEG